MKMNFPVLFLTLASCAAVVSQFDWDWWAYVGAGYISLGHAIKWAFKS